MIDAERDPLIRWALHAPGARVWRRPGAVVVACPDLSHGDRLVMNGEPAMLAELLPEALAETGGTFRPFGAEDLVGAVVARLPELEVSARFAWMETTGPVQGDVLVAAPTEPPGPGERDGATSVGEAGWLGEQDWPEVTELLRWAYPASYAWPGRPGVRRWSGIRDAGGELLAVAAEAWSTREIGFMSGIATVPEARGRGLGAAIGAFTANELLDGRDRVALLVDHWNTAALATYTRLGLVTRRVAAARRR